MLRGDDVDEADRVTRAELTTRVHEAVGLSRAESARLVEQVLEAICGALADGENVKLSGFGTFLLRDKGKRQGRNPRTGNPVEIAPRRVLSFRPSQQLRDRIADPS